MKNTEKILISLKTGPKTVREISVDIKLNDAHVREELVTLLNEKKIYSTTGDASPYGGCGWFRTRKKNGVLSYLVQWVHRCQLGMNTKTGATKGEQLTYQTTTMQGDVMGAQVDETMKTLYVDEIPVATEAEAYALLRELAHIPSPAQGASEQ